MIFFLRCIFEKKKIVLCEECAGGLSAGAGYEPVLLAPPRKHPRSWKSSQKSCSQPSTIPVGTDFLFPQVKGGEGARLPLAARGVRACVCVVVSPA